MAEHITPHTPLREGELTGRCICSPSGKASSKAVLAQSIPTLAIVLGMTGKCQQGTGCGWGVRKKEKEMIRFFFLNQPINYINFSIDLLWGHIIRLVNVVHEDRIMLRFQTVQKVHPKQHAKMETSALPHGCASHYPPEESQTQHLQILYMLLKGPGSQGGWELCKVCLRQ